MEAATMEGAHSPQSINANRVRACQQRWAPNRATIKQYSLRKYLKKGKPSVQVRPLFGTQLRRKPRKRAPGLGQVLRYQLGYRV